MKKQFSLPFLAFVFAAIFMLMPTCILAQTPTEIKLTELRAKLKSLGDTQTDNEKRVETLCDMGAIYSRLSLDSSRMYINDALKLSKKIGYKMGQARASLFIANVDGHTGKTAKALEGYKEALALYEELKFERGIVSCYINLGTICQEEGKYPEAESYFLKTIAVYDTAANNNNNRELSIALYNLGELYTSGFNDPARGLPYMEKAVLIMDEVDDKSARVAFYLGLGGCLTQLNRPTEGLGFFLKALQLARETGDRHGIASSYSQIAEVYVKRKDITKALSYLSEAEASFQDIEDKIELMNIYEKQYEIYSQANDYTNAIEALKKELPIVKGIDNKDQLRSIYEHLEAAYMALGDTGKAKKYKELAAELVKKE